MTVEEFRGMIADLPGDLPIRFEVVSGGPNGEPENARVEDDYYDMGRLVVIDIT